MFRIRFSTPVLTNDEGWQHAGGEFLLDDTRLCFNVDLSHWGMSAYRRQWRRALERLAEGAPSSAFMTAYRGAGDSVHVMWAIWCNPEGVFVQEHAVVPSDLEAPFDPDEPYSHVGFRIPAAANSLPIPEWRVDLQHLNAALRGIRSPDNPN